MSRSTTQQQAGQTRMQLDAIKRKSPACLLFYGTTPGYWTARGSDAVEACFCTSTALNFSRKHIPDEETSVVFPSARLADVIARLTRCGNPVATIDEDSGEVQTYWPASYELPVDEAEPPPPFIPATTYEPGVEWLDFNAISNQIRGQVALPDFTFSDLEQEAPF